MVYKVPLTHLLSPKARDMFNELLNAKESVGLDYVSDTIASIVKKTMEYDFEDHANRVSRTPEETQILQKDYQSNRKPIYPTLKGICSHGSAFGKLLLHSLNIQNIVIKTCVTTFEDGLQHSIIRVTSPQGHRLINAMSAVIPFGMVKNKAQLKDIGVSVEGKTILDNLVSRNNIGEKQFGDSDEKVFIIPQEPLLDVFKFPSDIRVSGDDNQKIVMRVLPVQDGDYLSGQLLTFHPSFALDLEMYQKKIQMIQSPIKQWLEGVKWIKKGERIQGELRNKWKLVCRHE